MPRRPVAVVTVTVELIAETLAAHQVSTDYFRRRASWAWWCSCHTDGEGVHPSGVAAEVAAARHQAQMVHQALIDGAPPVVPVGGGA